MEKNLKHEIGKAVVGGIECLPEMDIATDFITFDTDAKCKRLVQYGGYDEYDGTVKGLLKAAFSQGVQAGAWIQKNKPLVLGIQLIHRDNSHLVDLPTFGWKATVYEAQEDRHD